MIYPCDVSHRFKSYKRLQKWLNVQISNYNNNCKIIGNFKQTIDLKRTAWKYYRGNRRKTDNTMVKTGQTPMTRNITQKTKDRVTRTPLKTLGAPRWPACGICPTTLVTNPMISNEWEKDGISIRHT